VPTPYTSYKKIVKTKKNLIQTKNIQIIFINPAGHMHCFSSLVIGKTILGIGHSLLALMARAQPTVLFSQLLYGHLPASWKFIIAVMIHESLKHLSCGQFDMSR